MAVTGHQRAHQLAARGQKLLAIDRQAHPWKEKVSEAARSIPASAAAETAIRTVKKPPFSTNSHSPGTPNNSWTYCQEVHGLKDKEPSRSPTPRTTAERGGPVRSRIPIRNGKTAISGCDLTAIPG
jgi:hypothetical protein